MKTFIHLIVKRDPASDSSYVPLWETARDNHEDAWAAAVEIFGKQQKTLQTMGYEHRTMRASTVPEAPRGANQKAANALALMVDMKIKDLTPLPITDDRCSVSRSVLDWMAFLRDQIQSFANTLED